MTKWMHGIILALATVVLSIPFGGCTSGRVTARPLVADIGPVIATKYKYKITNVRFFNQCKSQYPEVFSENGIPVFLKYNHISYKGPDFLPGFLSLLISSCSCSIIPAFFFGDSETTARYDIRFGDGNAPASSSFVMESDRKEAMSIFLPTALILYNGKPSENNRHRTFWRHYDYVGTSVEKIAHKLTLSNHVSGEAYAYGLAVRLKELEDSAERIDA